MPLRGVDASPLQDVLIRIYMTTDRRTRDRISVAGFAHASAPDSISGPQPAHAKRGTRTDGPLRWLLRPLGHARSPPPLRRPSCEPQAGSAQQRGPARRSPLKLAIRAPRPPLAVQTPSLAQTLPEAWRRPATARLISDPSFFVVGCGLREIALLATGPRYRPRCNHSAPGSTAGSWMGAEGLVKDPFDHQSRSPFSYYFFSYSASSHCWMNLRPLLPYLFPTVISVTAVPGRPLPFVPLSLWHTLAPALCCLSFAPIDAFADASILQSLAFLCPLALILRILWERRSSVSSQHWRS